MDGLNNILAVLQKDAPLTDFFFLGRNWFGSVGTTTTGD
jgi:hypothetical protein